MSNEEEKKEFTEEVEQEEKPVTEVEDKAAITEETPELQETPGDKAGAQAGEVKEEAPQKAAKQEPPAEPAAKKPEEPKPHETAEIKPKKKIKQLTLAEVNKKLEKIKQEMGGFNSNYAQELIKRKEMLEK
ncbi:MAG: hypothetical protein ABIH89_05260 [Elusimicrobiota bacterium]